MAFSNIRKFVIKNKEMTKDEKMKLIIQTEKDLELTGENFQFNLDHKLNDYIITTKTDHSSNFVQNYGNFEELSRSTNNNTKKYEYVIKGIPLDFPLQYIEDRLSERGSIKAFRLKYHDKTSNSLKESRSVKLVCEFKINDERLTLGMLGIRDITKFSKPILRCYKCQKFGHVQKNCKNTVQCGICAESHYTKLCLERKSANLPVVIKCVNCGENHESRYFKCTKRLEFIQKLSNNDSVRSSKNPNRKNLFENTDLHFPALTTNNLHNRIPTNVKSVKILAIKEEMTNLREKLNKLEKMLDEVLCYDENESLPDIPTVLPAEDISSSIAQVNPDMNVSEIDSSSQLIQDNENNNNDSQKVTLVDDKNVDKNVVEINSITQISKVKDNNYGNDNIEDDDEEIYLTPSESINSQTDLNDSGIIDASKMKHNL